MAEVTIRTITIGIPEPHPATLHALKRAAEILAAARTAAENAGYTVQTTRLALRPLLEDLADQSNAQIERYASQLQQACDDIDAGFCSIGPAPADDPSFPLERLDLLPSLLIPHPALSATAQLASVRHSIRTDAAERVAQVMHALGTHSTGETNFRFAALSMCDPGGPFFPQAYHRASEWSVSVGLQSAGLVNRVIAGLAEKARLPATILTDIPSAIQAALTREVGLLAPTIVKVLQQFDVAFGGFDLSPAPMAAESIADAIESAGLGVFGESGTLAVSAAITIGIRSVETLTCGYNGLMLPVLEDATIGERAAEGKVSTLSLLAFSAVCGTGLDTVPIPADTDRERIAALLLDMASLAYRLRKPLSARLFLVPGAKVGDLTNFASPYLTNTRVMPL